MNSRNNFLTKATPYRVFTAVLAAGALSFLIFAFINRSAATFDWLIMQHTSDYSFADYFYHVFYGSDLSKTYNAYDVDPCFPPFSYLFYHYLYQIAPVDQMTSLREVQFFPYYMFIFVIGMAAAIVFFSYSIDLFMDQGRTDEECRKKRGQNLLLTLLLLFSVPIGASAVERANSAFIVLILLIFAMAFKDSENKVLRELALILIAVSANLKLYPAIFGLLYLKEKRWKEALRLILYGVLLFIVPFFFMEGFKSIKEFLVILYLMQGRSIERMTTVRGVVTSLYMHFGGEEAKWTGHHVGIIVENIYLAVTLTGFFLSRNRWKSMFLLISPMVVYVSSAYRYTAAYFTIALLFFLAENERDYSEKPGRKQVLNVIYALLFAGIFAIPIWGYGMELENIIYGFIYILLIVVTADTFLSLRAAGPSYQ
ncbi:MAG: glycosyltransferase 87 family protein [Lachnospiraceae bacterium]|nr:glycosyltransferase 87 family protein [Lachnospiraceae bacterium]